MGFKVNKENFAKSQVFSTTGVVRAVLRVAWRSAALVRAALRMVWRALLRVALWRAGAALCSQNFLWVLRVVLRVKWRRASWRAGWTACCQILLLCRARSVALVWDAQCDAQLSLQNL